MARMGADGREYSEPMVRWLSGRPRAGVSPSSIAAAGRGVDDMNHGRRSDPASAFRDATRICGAAVLSSLVLAGCAENGDFTKAVNWFNRSTGGPPQKTVLALPDDPEALGTEGIEGQLRNAMELSKAKRFAEARAIMGEVAGQLPPDSDFWRAVKCSEMVLALRGNELPALLEAAEAVERNLKDPLRPPGECVSQLSIARALRGQPLPLNVPESLGSALAAVPKPRDVRAAQAAPPAKAVESQPIKQVSK